jgi:hypothetical protein
VASSKSPEDIDTYPASTLYTLTPIMTTFAQRPNIATPNTSQYAMQQSNSQHQVPASTNQQHMLGQQRSAPRMQPYSDQDQHYQQYGYAQETDRLPGQNHHLPYLDVSSCEAATSDSGYGQQLRPTLDQRHSESSFRSARSRKSTRSIDSHQSHRSSKSAHSHRSHHSHHGADRELKSRKKERDIDVRPTMGDSVMLVVNHFRDLLSSDRR